MKRLLLISNSTMHGQSYLEHCADQIRARLEGVRTVLFVPYAIHDRDGYAAKATARYAELGFEMSSVHQADDPVRAVERAEAFFVGGGNTFRLLKTLYDVGLIEAIRRRVESGAPYIGSSAGSNVACVTVRTTNDMPIVEPPSFDALGLVPFNINPHYLDPDPASPHMGETREERIREFLEENDRTVVALREGCMLRVDASSALLQGTTDARVFRRGREPEEFSPGASLDFLLR